jgi:hypothetical protein
MKFLKAELAISVDCRINSAMSEYADCIMHTQDMKASHEEKQILFNVWIINY